MSWLTDLETLSIVKDSYACGPAMHFARQFDCLEDAWSACDRTDWLTWYGQAIGADLEALATHLGVELVDEDEVDEDGVEADFYWGQLENGHSADDIRAFWPFPPLPKLQSESLNAHNSMLADSRKSEDP